MIKELPTKSKVDTASKKYADRDIKTQTTLEVGVFLSSKHEE